METVMNVNAIRELTTAELNEVAGGLVPLGVIYGAELVLGLLAIDLWTENSVTSSIPVGDWLSGKGRPT
jgi:lactobin A/cerein 7B family class IIb bacteriocin